MYDYFDCPDCSCEMQFDSIDEKGTYYVCTNCGHQYCDDSARLEDEDLEEEEF